MRAVDLRSDLLSRPTAAAIDAMARAAAMPGEFGLRDDPAQRDLEACAAGLLGKEDALLFPTCTMANGAALILQSRPGDVLLAQEDAHIATSEAGAPAALAGLLLRTVQGGIDPPAARWAEFAVGGDALRPAPALVVIENTHTRSGGRPLSADYTGRVAAVAREAGLRAHLDGARLVNAAVALGTSPAELAAGFDTVSLSLNKGVGAPLGAILAGEAELIVRALPVRQRLGGGIRPTAPFAAAARVMLDRWEDVADDHRRARQLAQALAELDGVDVPPPPTNILLVHFTERGGGRESPARLCAALVRAGLLALPFGPGTVRLVTYRGVSDEDVAAAVAAVADVSRDRPDVARQA